MQVFTFVFRICDSGAYLEELRGPFCVFRFWRLFGKRGYKRLDGTKGTLAEIIEESCFAKEMDIVCANLNKIARIVDPSGYKHPQFPYISLYFTITKCPDGSNYVFAENLVLGSFRLKVNSLKADTLEDLLIRKTRDARIAKLPLPIAEAVAEHL